MGQPTQRATNYTARSNIVTAQIFLHANGQRPKRASNRQRSRRRQARGATHRARPRSPSRSALAQHISHSHSGIDEKRPTEKFVRTGANLPTNVQAVSPAVSYVNTHRPRFQVRARPSYGLTMHLRQRALVHRRAQRKAQLVLALAHGTHQLERDTDVVRVERGRLRFPSHRHGLPFSSNT